jgi:hypothetical protein
VRFRDGGGWREGVVEFPNWVDRKVRDSAVLQPPHPKATAGTSTQQHAMPPNFHVGQRLSFESALCTVRYIGPVEGTEKEWLGVEWDDSSRGKHDGEHKGVRYFRCKRRTHLKWYIESKQSCR